MVCGLGCMAWNVRVTGNDEFIKRGKGEAIAHFNVLF
jgi:hypothetical protein